MTRHHRETGGQEFTAHRTRLTLHGPAVCMSVPVPAGIHRWRPGCPSWTVVFAAYIYVCS
jgi:hypothetical protein